MKRRSLLTTVPALAGLAVLPAAAAEQGLLRRTIPASGEKISAVGLGTWLTFDVGEEVVARTRRLQVLQAFFGSGGGMIDSSPMYGRAEKLLGELLPQVEHRGKLFAATKVWTAFTGVGPTQMAESLRLWGQGADGSVPGAEPRRFDLMQVHNLLNWTGHIRTLRAWRDAGAGFLRSPRDGVTAQAVQRDSRPSRLPRALLRGQTPWRPGLLVHSWVVWHRPGRATSGGSRAGRALGVRRLQRLDRADRARRDCSEPLRVVPDDPARLRRYVRGRPGPRARQPVEAVW